MAQIARVDPRRYGNGQTISRAGVQGSLSIVLYNENNKEIHDVLTGRMVQTGMPIAELAELMIQTIPRDADYVGAWEQFQPNILSMVYSTGVRLFIIDMDKLARRWPVVREFMSIGLLGMFNSIGFQVLSLRPMDNVNAIIDAKDLKHIQTGSYGLCRFGSVGVTHVKDIDDYLQVDAVKSRQVNGRAFRSAVMSRSVFSVGATLSDILTAYHSESGGHNFSGLGLDDAYTVDEDWDGRIADSMPFNEWFDVLSKVLGRYDHVSVVGSNYMDIEFKNMKLGDYFFIQIEDARMEIQIPIGCTVCPTPYSKGICVYGMMRSSMMRVAVSLGGLRAWAKRPIELHHAQARCLVESCIHRRDTMSMVMELRPTRIKDVFSPKVESKINEPIIFLGGKRASMESPYSVPDKLVAMERYGAANGWYVDGSDPRMGEIQLGESMHALRGEKTDDYPAFDHSNSENLIRVINDEFCVLKNDVKTTDYMLQILRRMVAESTVVLTNSLSNIDGVVCGPIVKDSIKMVDALEKVGRNVVDAVHHINRPGRYYIESEVEENNIRWYANSWGKNWSTNDVPTLWTKNTRQDDQQQRDFDQYNDGRGMLFYNEDMTLQSLGERIKQFAAEYGGEVDVWLQGTLESLNPSEQVEYFRDQFSTRTEEITVPYGVGISEFLTRRAKDSFDEVDPRPIICLYSLSNTVNPPLDKIAPDVIDCIDLFNYPDMTSVTRTHRQLVFGDPTDLPVPALKAFGDEISLTAPHSEVSAITFETDMESEESRYFKLSVKRVLAEDNLFLRPITNVIDRSVAGKVVPYIENRIGKKVLMLGEAPGELAETLAMMYPETEFMVTSKRPEREDDLVFLDSLSSIANVKTRYVDAINAIKTASVEKYDLIISDVGVRDIHIKSVEREFNMLFKKIIDSHSKYCPETPMIVKGYTPTLEYYDFKNVCYVKPPLSGEKNREFYAIIGWIPRDCMTLEKVVSRQLDALLTIVSDVQLPEYMRYHDWAINPNGVVTTHDFSSMPQFSTYMTYNFNISNGMLYDPNSDDSRRWLVFNRRTGPFSSQLVDTHANTISYTARIMGTLIRNRTNMRDEILYDVRRQIGLIYFDSIGVKANVIPSDLVVNGVRIGGRVHLQYEDGDEMLYASISGHLISEILYSDMFQSLDFRRFFNIVLKGKPPMKYKNHRLNGFGGKIELGNILAERQAYDGKVLWHNYHEYSIALRVAIALAATLGIRLSQQTISLIHEILEDNKALLSGESHASQTIRGKRAGGKSSLNIR